MQPEKKKGKWHKESRFLPGISEATDNAATAGAATDAQSCLS